MWPDYIPNPEKSGFGKAEVCPHSSRTTPRLLCCRWSFATTYSVRDLLKPWITHHAPIEAKSRPTIVHVTDGPCISTQLAKHRIGRSRTSPMPWSSQSPPSAIAKPPAKAMSVFRGDEVFIRLPSRLANQVNAPFHSGASHKARLPGQRRDFNTVSGRPMRFHKQSLRF